ncbi:unnamed protein product [Camellia sinensis]
MHRVSIVLSQLSTPQAQTILHCLLRHVLQAEINEAALDESLYELDGKLYEPSAADSYKLSPRFFSLLGTGGNLLTREASNGHTAGSVRCRISFGSYVLCQVQRANSHPSHSFKTIRVLFDLFQHDICSCGKLIACDSEGTYVSQRLACLRLWIWLCADGIVLKYGSVVVGQDRPK